MRVCPWGGSIELEALTFIHGGVHCGTDERAPRHGIAHRVERARLHGRHPNQPPHSVPQAVRARTWHNRTLFAVDKMAPPSALIFQIAKQHTTCDVTFRIAKQHEFVVGWNTDVMHRTANDMCGSKEPRAKFAICQLIDVNSETSVGISRIRQFSEPIRADKWQETRSTITKKKRCPASMNLQGFTCHPGKLWRRQTVDY